MQEVAMTLVRWNPRQEILQLRNELDRLFRSVDESKSDDTHSSIVWNPVVDVREDHDGYEVQFEIPGMDKKNIKIDYSDDTLSISGERNVEHAKKEHSYHRIERARGRFFRSLTFPAKVLPDRISATYTDGVLLVRIPKAEESKPKQISIS
jgi:HSP20 family protein